MKSDLNSCNKTISKPQNPFIGKSLNLEYMNGSYFEQTINAENQKASS